MVNFYRIFIYKIYFNQIKKKIYMYNLRESSYLVDNFQEKEKSRSTDHEIACSQSISIINANRNGKKNETRKNMEKILFLQLIK